MDVRNCKNCGRLFNYLSGPSICPVCRSEADKKFAQVKEYIRENPGVTIQMVADDNEVSVQQIRQWVREERLEFAENSPVGIECEVCGATIRTGRFCDSCKGRMKNDFSSAIRKPVVKEPEVKKKNKDRDKMRFLD